MVDPPRLPSDFLHLLRELEASYLQADDPIRQSGFGGGPERWRAEREPILKALEADGELLDVGCANGYLLECLVAWAQARGITLTPYGVDQGAGLIELARQRQPGLAANFFVGNAWDWQPPQQFQYVYALHDCVPLDYLAAFVFRLLSWVRPGGRLILGAYGSRSRGTPPFEIGAFLEENGFAVSGMAHGGDPPMTSFAWIESS